MPRQAKNRATKKASESQDRRDVEWLGIQQLRFDPLNPRLPEGYEDVRQNELLQILADEFELQEIGQSLADNGYFSEEPLVVIPRRRSNEFVVVEGNRRLAALKLLENPDAAPKAYRTTWRDLSRQRLIRIREVPVLVYDTRDQIIPYLGFRHISGVLQWRPYQKAKYISQLVEKLGKTFAQIARIVGSKQPTVREHYVAYTLLRQAREAFSIDTIYAEEAFGVLRRSLSDPDIRDYIGLKLDQSLTKLAKPIPPGKSARLMELLSWMFGDDENDAVLRDSRQIKNLGVVLAINEATRVLRDTRDLDYAFEMAGGEETRLIEALNKASYHLDKALPMTLRHKTSREIKRAVGKCYQVFRAILKSFPDITEGN